MTPIRSPSMARQPPNNDTAEDDMALVAATVAGDRRKFHELYRRHLDAVYGRLTRIVGPVAERDDLTQQIFIDLFAALPRFRGEARFSTFLHRIVVNVAYDHLTRQRRIRSRTAPLDEQQLDRLIAPALSPEARAEKRQELAQVFEHLAAIRPQKRIAFVLVAVDGLSLAEAAELVAANVDTVKQRVLHARRELAARIARAAKAKGEQR
jgi:RNA polymerase sigma-70 factor (ECF subfamily)